MIPEEYILLPLQNFSYAFNVGWAELAVIPAKAGTQEVPHLLGFASSTQPTVFSLSHQHIIHTITGNLKWKRYIYSSGIILRITLFLIRSSDEFYINLITRRLTI